MHKVISCFILSPEYAMKVKQAVGDNLYHKIRNPLQPFSPLRDIQGII